MGVTVEGLDEVSRQIERALTRVRNLRPALVPAAAEIRSMIDAAWEQRRSPSGVPWAPSSSDGGSLRTAHEVVVGNDSIAIVVDHEAASFQFFGTSHVPARNPLPVERDGSIPASGRAAEFWREHATRLETYLAGEE